MRYLRWGLLLLLMIPGVSGAAASRAATPQADTLSLQVHYAQDWVGGITNPDVPVLIIVFDDQGLEKSRASVTADEAGHFFTLQEHWIPEVPDIVPGDAVSAEVAEFTAEINPVGTIQGMVDLSSDTVAGKLDASWFEGTLDVACEIPGEPSSVISHTASSSGGDFLCDFGDAAWDLLPTTPVAMSYSEPDGDRVINTALVHFLQVNYAHDLVAGSYEPGHTFWITVTDAIVDPDDLSIKAEGIAVSTPDGGPGGPGFSEVAWSPAPPDIHPGDHVLLLADNGYENEVKVGEINGLLDLAADTVGGTLLVPQFNRELLVECLPWGAWEAGLDDIPEKQDMAASDGSEPFLCEWGSAWDIVPGQDVAVMYHEPDGNRVIDVYREPAPYLRVSQWMRGQAAAGGNLAIRVRMQNDGDGPAEQVALSSIPSGLVYLGDSSSFPVSGGGSEPLIWDAGSLQAGEVIEFDVFFEVTAGVGESLSHWIQISTTSFDTGDPAEKEAFLEGVVRTNDTHLTVSKRSRTEDPAAASEFVYVIAVCNEGATGSSEVTLVDQPAEPLSLVAWWAGEAGWFEEGFTPERLEVKLPSLPGFTCNEIYIRALVAADAPPDTLLINVANISAANDLEPDDNEATLELRTAEPHINLQVTKTGVPASPWPGGELRYMLEFANSGNVPVNSVFEVIDTFPVGTSFTRAWLHSDGQRIEFPPTEVWPEYAVWQFPELDNGASQQIEIALAVSPEAVPGTEMANTVAITELPGEDSHADNASVWHDSLRPAGPNLAISKSSAAAGDGVNYEIRFTNLGSETIQNVLVTDTLPPFATFDGSWWLDEDFDLERLLSFEQDGNQLLWLFSEMHPGESGAIHFHADLELPEPDFVFINAVEITLPPEDVEPGNNVALDYHNAQPAIDIEKTTNGHDADDVPGPFILVGDTVTWEYLVTNTGNVTLSGIILTDDQVGEAVCPGTELEVGASMTCSASGTAVAGQYANVGTVTANPPGGLAVVTDSDPSHYFGTATDLIFKDGFE